MCECVYVYISNRDFLLEHIVPKVLIFNFLIVDTFSRWIIFIFIEVVITYYYVDLVTLFICTVFDGTAQKT